MSTSQQTFTTSCFCFLFFMFPSLSFSYSQSVLTSLSASSTHSSVYWSSSKSPLLLTNSLCFSFFIHLRCAVKPGHASPSSGCSFSNSVFIFLLNSTNSCVFSVVTNLWYSYQYSSSLEIYSYFSSLILFISCSLRLFILDA